MNYIVMIIVSSIFYRNSPDLLHNVHYLPTYKPTNQPINAPQVVGHMRRHVRYLQKQP